jgi:hypothetical protein
MFTSFSTWNPSRCVGTTSPPPSYFASSTYLLLHTYGRVSVLGTSVEQPDSKWSEISCRIVAKCFTPGRPSSVLVVEDDDDDDEDEEDAKLR